MLAPVKDAARRLRRWPAAILDRRCAWRDEVLQAGTEKRPQAEPRNVACRIMVPAWVQSGSAMPSWWAPKLKSSAPSSKLRCRVVPAFVELHATASMLNLEPEDRRCPRGSKLPP